MKSILIEASEYEPRTGDLLCFDGKGWHTTQKSVLLADELLREKELLKRVAELESCLAKCKEDIKTLAKAIKEAL